MGARKGIDLQIDPKTLSPIELGIIFAEWDSEKQCDFLNSVASYAKYHYATMGWESQTYHIVHEAGFTLAAGKLIEVLHEAVEAYRSKD